MIVCTQYELVTGKPKKFFHPRLGNIVLPNISHAQAEQLVKDGILTYRQFDEEPVPPTPVKRRRKYRHPDEDLGHSSI
jgi:hypothetical protein